MDISLVSLILSHVCILHYIIRPSLLHDSWTHGLSPVTVFLTLLFLSHFYSPDGGATVKSRQFCQIYVAITVTLLCYPDSRSQIPQFWIMELKKIGSRIAIRNILSMWWINMFVSSCSGLWSKWFWDTCGCSSIHVMNLHSQESLIFHIAVLIIELSPTSSMKPSVVVCPCIRYVNVSGSFKNGFM